MGKKLNVGNLKKEAKKLAKVKRIELDGGYFVEIEETFAERKITTLYTDLANSIEYAKDKGIDMEIVSIVDWLMFYTIKHFTSLGESIPSNLNEQIQVFEYLIDLGYYKAICESFNKDELQKVVNKANELNMLYEETLRIMKERKEELDKLDLQVLNQ